MLLTLQGNYNFEIGYTYQKVHINQQIHRNETSTRSIQKQMGDNITRFLAN